MATTSDLFNAPCLWTQEECQRPPNPSEELSTHLPFCYFKAGFTGPHWVWVGQSVSASGVKHSSCARSEEKLMNHPCSCWQGTVITPVQQEMSDKAWTHTQACTHTGVHTHHDINYSPYECAPGWLHGTWFLTVISNYNSHFSPLQAALHLGQRTFTSKIVSKQTVPWGWIAVIKPGHCYEPYDKDTEIMLWMLQIPAMLLFVPLQQLFKGYYSKYIEVRCNYKHREK